MERRGVEWVVKYDRIPFVIPDAAQAFLLIEADGTNMDVLFTECEKINNVLVENGQPGISDPAMGLI